MKNCNLISIIVPVYNIEAFIGICLDSIIGQTYPYLEIIVVDDGSTDDSGKICDGYALKDSRIKVIHKSNGGLSDARNTGLAAATGSYIGYVDGDDWIAPDMYEKMLEACITRNAEIAICRYKEVYQDRIVDGGSDQVVLLPREEVLRYYMDEHSPYIIYNSVWSKLFRRDMVQGVEFPVGHNSEDIIYTTKAFCKSSNCVYLDEGLYSYVIEREGSIMNAGNGARCLNDEIPFLRQQIAYFEEQGLAQIGLQATTAFYHRLLIYYMNFMKEKQNRGYAKAIIQEVRKDKLLIEKLAKSGQFSRGDKARIKLALTAPYLYYLIVRFYDMVVIPIRRKTGK